MKKTLILATLALSSLSISALELGVVGGRDTAGTNRTSYGLTLGQKFGPLGVEGSVERQYQGPRDLNRFSLLGTYDVVKLGPVTLTGKAGAAYLSTQTGSSGYAAVAGVGASYAITPKLAATLDFRRQFSQNKVQAFDGNTVLAGVKYSF